MQTTLILDDDVLAAATDLAHREDKPLGKIVSELARKSLRSSAQTIAREDFPVLTVRDATPVTVEFVEQLQEEAGE